MFLVDLLRNHYDLQNRLHLNKYFYLFGKYSLGIGFSGDS